MVEQLDMFRTGATPFMVGSVKRDQRMHDNSVTAYREEGSKLGKRASEVLAFFRHAGRALPDREVMKALGYSDMNAVRPRITELIDAGLLRQTGQTIDYVSRKRVRLVEAA